MIRIRIAAGIALFVIGVTSVSRIAVSPSVDRLAFVAIPAAR